MEMLEKCVWAVQREKFCDICGLEEAVVMATRDGEYCFLYCARFIDNFTDFKSMSLGNCVIIWCSRI